MSLHGPCTILGTAYPDAYVKVLNITGNLVIWTASVQIFSSVPDLTSTPSLVNTLQITFPYEPNVDPFVTAYGQLLLITEFKNMTPNENTTISKLEFLQKFTAQERQTLYTVAKTNVVVEDYIKQMDAAKFIDVSRLDTIAGVTALEAAGLLSPGRAVEILSPITTP